MRRGSVAIVPALLAVMLLFWFIAFLGGASDTLHTVNNVENLQHLQQKLLLSAAKHRNGLSKVHPEWSDDELTIQTDAYIDEIMVLNNIQPQ
jgi:hypothetical protein